MSADAEERRQLGARFDELYRRGSRARLARITRRALPRAVEAGLYASLVLPLGLIATALLARAGGPNPRDFGWLQALAGMAAISAAVVAVRLYVARSRPVERAEVLGECDRLLEADGRLLAADDFVRAGATGPFVAAALEEGRTQLDRANGLQFPAGPDVPGVRARSFVAAAAALMLAWFVTRGEVPPVDQLADTDTAIVPALPTNPEQHVPEKPVESEPPAPQEPRADQPTKPATRGERAELASEGTPPSDHVKDSKGRTKGGRSSAAKSSSGSGASRGAPSSQSQESAESEEKAAPGKRPKEGKAEEPESERKQDEDASGATAGRGSGSGSTKNPATSDWTSKDHVEAQPDDDQGEDADVDDEESDSEARGGVQPSLRDRRPPVNRDLQIGFASGRPDPDANGRGGPSPQKKSRGVASLVLGVPIPDHIKGRANPGRTKVTQERVEPEAEDSTPAVAESRRARETSAGTIERHELTPWMRELVRKYFERPETAKETTE
ncbi:MAG: hypothetical protein H6831_14155 [Planctomycetes bacterium]|nr:hypothetical protein [Planctomycetota bacterium]MCB9905544.1 hypothetical protein [Planctomycetota bacterium]